MNIDSVTINDIREIETFDHTKKIVRLEHSGTNPDVIIKLIKDPSIKEITFASNKCALNKNTMVVIAKDQKEEIFILADRIKLNIARSSRDHEVKSIFNNVFKNKEKKYYFLKNVVEKTSNLSLINALNIISSKSHSELNKESLGDYLQTLGHWEKNNEYYNINEYIENKYEGNRT